MAVSISNISPVAIERRGGTKLTVTGTFPVTGSFEVRLVSTGGVETACYSGVPGQGNVVFPKSGTTLECYNPSLVEGLYDVKVVELPAVDDDTLAAALTLTPEHFHQNNIRIKSYFPNWWAVGDRGLPTILIDAQMYFGLVSPQDGQANSAYSYFPPFTAQNPVTITDANGNFPSWVAINPVTGEFTGTVPVENMTHTNLQLKMVDSVTGETTYSNVFTLTSYIQVTIFTETFETAWYDVAPIPSPTFPTATFVETFETAWYDVAPVPAPTFPTATFIETFDFEWNDVLPDGFDITVAVLNGPATNPLAMTVAVLSGP